MKRDKIALIQALLLLISCGTGCLAELAEDTEESATEGSTEALFVSPGTPMWPDGKVPVCWNPESTRRADFAELSELIKFAALNGWPAVAWVDFTGWGTCPANRGETVQITIWDRGDCRSHLGTVGRQVPFEVDLSIGGEGSTCVDVGTVWEKVNHEFGHVLGFRHEFQRPDFKSTSTCTKRNSFASGNTLNTYSDPKSIMNSGYCDEANNNNNLTIWDEVGAQTAYKPRNSSIVPLISGWNTTRKDTISGVYGSGIELGNQNGYRWLYDIGWVVHYALPGTRPLKIYWHSGRQDYFVVGSAASESAAIAAGYTLATTSSQGRVFTTQVPGTVPVNTYWNQTNQDHMLVREGSMGEYSALISGYTKVRTEGYVFGERPYHLLTRYWHPGRQDHVLTNPTWELLGSGWRTTEGYRVLGNETTVFRFPIPGTVPLEVHRHSGRQDDFTLASSASRTAAVNAGYVLYSDPVVGFVHTSSTFVSGMIPLTSYWSSARQDHFTKLDLGGAAPTGYTRVREEGYALNPRTFRD